MSIFYGEYKVMAKRKLSKLGRSDFAVNEEDKYVAAVGGGAIVAEERLEDDNNVETCEDVHVYTHNLCSHVNLFTYTHTNTYMYD
ncbi:hypothetical protein Bca4012_003418 [Brassica carinata]